jgi:hypothetical protein
MALYKAIRQITGIYGTKAPGDFVNIDDPKVAESLESRGLIERVQIFPNKAFVPPTPPPTPLKKQAVEPDAPKEPKLKTK